MNGPKTATEILMQMKERERSYVTFNAGLMERAQHRLAAALYQCASERDFLTAFIEMAAMLNAAYSASHVGINPEMRGTRAVR